MTVTTRYGQPCYSARLSDDLEMIVERHPRSGLWWAWIFAPDILFAREGSTPTDAIRAAITGYRELVPLTP